jgi:preprotein translocase subunit SecG
MGVIFGTVLSVLAIFLILLVLVQRGRGGGLTGALGGMGGSSAFGAKAGDIFTRITIVAAGIWILTCAAAVYWANNQGDRLGAASTALPSATPSGPALETPPTKAGEDTATTPATGTPAVETPAGSTPAADAPATTAPSAEASTTDAAAPATESGTQ